MNPWGTFTLHNLRSTLLMNPIQLPLVLALMVVSITFTFWPQALDHSPVGFEQRGVVHHVWHYTLLLGSSLTLAGMLSTGRSRLQVEFIGLCLLIGMLAVNLIAMVGGAYANAEPGVPPLAGMDVALRAGLILGLAVRAWTVVKEPTVDLVTTETNGG